MGLTEPRRRGQYAAVSPSINPMKNARGRKRYPGRAACGSVECRGPGVYLEPDDHYQP